MPTKCVRHQSITDDYYRCNEKAPAPVLERVLFRYSVYDSNSIMTELNGAIDLLWLITAQR